MDEGQTSRGVSRRTVVKAAAWSLPVMAIGAPAQAQTASGPLTLTGTGCKLPGNSQPFYKGYVFSATVSNPYPCPITITIQSLTLDGDSLGAVGVVFFSPPPNSVCQLAGQNTFTVGANVSGQSVLLLTQNAGNSQNGALILTYQITGSCVTTQVVTVGTQTDASPPIQGNQCALSDAQKLCIASLASAPPVEFVGRTVGGQGATSIALPAGWQAGDLAVMVVMRNATATQPTIPSGWTRPAQTTAGTGSSQVTSSLFTKVLAAGDTDPSWGAVTFRAALVMVYRNAALGAVNGQGGTSTTITIPALTLQQTTGTSWVGAMATNFNGLRDVAAPTGMVSRTLNGGGSTTGPGGFDTSGGVSSWASRTITGGQPWNAFSFELRNV